MSGQTIEELAESLDSEDMCGLTRGFVDDLEKAISSETGLESCLLYTSPSPRDRTRSRMPSSA